MSKKWLFIILVLVPILTKAQRLQNITIDTDDNGKIFSEFLHEIQKKENVIIVFNEQLLKKRTVYGIKEKIFFLNYIEDYLTQYNIIKLEDNILFVVSKVVAEGYGKRKDNYMILKGELGVNSALIGKVVDGSINEPVIGAQVIIPSKNIGAVTDINGRFSIETQADLLEINVSFIGFEKKSLIVGFHPDVGAKEINFVIHPEYQELKSVVVTAEGPDKNVKATLPGVERMGIESIKNLPTFMGEVDPIKSLTTLPGVSMVGELSTGFNVRGGETGQNLILQDNATIYNPSHLFGFFSAFNPDLVSDVVLYKGGGPANYGSRVASVLDVSLRNGDAGHFKVSGGVGLVSSRLTLEGPIVKGKSSYIVGGRVSYSDWLLKATDNLVLNQSSAQFYDVTAKLFQTINEKNFLTFSLYNSYDDFNLASDSVFSWQTINASLLWDHTFNDQVNSSLSLASSNYMSQIQNLDEIEGFAYVNEINNLNIKYVLNYEPTDKLKITGGMEAVGILLEPGELNPLEPDNNVLASDMQDQKSLEAAVFAQADFKISSKLSMATGLRFSNFFRLGSDKIYQFDFEQTNGRYPAISDTLHYSENELIKYYNGLEPRLSLRYMVSADLSLKISYFRTFQYLHLISNTAAATPQDYWVTSGPYLKPAIGNQFSIGLFRNFGDNAYETSIETFYKTTKHAVDYIEGADITLNPALEAGLLQGKAFAYGVEALFKKTSGIFNGWISYTYSRSLRQFNVNAGSRREINKGELYPATYDQPHNLSLVTNHNINQRATFSLNFSYSSGRPITIPVSKYSYGPYLSVLNYSERNEYRIPDYHRLDLSLTVSDDPVKNSKYNGEWVFSIYNVYARKNAYSITFNKYGKAKKLSILGNIFPSIAYNFKF